jgi:hypothetical protein
MEKNTLDSYFAGGSQSNASRPYKVDNPKLYISQANVYNPLQNNSQFGVRKKHSKKRIKNFKKLKVRSKVQSSTMSFKQPTKKKQPKKTTK